MAGLVPLVSDEDADPEVAAVFADIRAVRQSEYINNFWRALANDPPMLQRVWSQVKEVMGPGELDPLVKEMIYVAVSVANNCEYCIRSHTAAARKKGLTDAQLGELLSVVALASQTNRLATGYQVPVDDSLK